MYGTTFLAEIGYIGHYAAYKKLIAFAGMDPTVYQHNATFRAYFMKKRNEGQQFKKAVFATAHKLVRVIFAMHTQRTMFRESCA